MFRPDRRCQGEAEFTGGGEPTSITESCPRTPTGRTAATRGSRFPRPFASPFRIVSLARAASALESGHDHVEFVVWKIDTSAEFLQLRGRDLIERLEFIEAVLLGEP